MSIAFHFNKFLNEAASDPYYVAAMMAVLTCILAFVNYTMRWTQIWTEEHKRLRGALAVGPYCCFFVFRGSPLFIFVQVFVFTFECAWAIYTGTRKCRAKFTKTN